MKYIKTLEEFLGESSSGISISDIKDELETFDWSYQYSDDRRWYDKGSAQRKKIERMIKDYLHLHPKDKKKILKISDNILNKKYSKPLPFSSNQWMVGI